MNLKDRIDDFKYQVTSTPEGRTKGIKLAAGCGLILIALIYVGVRQLGGEKVEVRPDATPGFVADVQTTTEELEKATEEEALAEADAIASGEKAPPPPIEKAIRPYGPKGIGFAPGGGPLPEPEPAAEPEQEDPS